MGAPRSDPDAHTLMAGNAFGAPSWSSKPISRKPGRMSVLGDWPMVNIPIFFMSLEVWLARHLSVTIEAVAKNRAGFILGAKLSQVMVRAT